MAAQMATSRFNGQRGFTLFEVLVAVAILATGIIALALLFVLAIQANQAARVTTSTMVLAQQKMEQLRGLQWGFDDLGLPLGDSTTDISVVPFTSGGAGLSLSPAGALEHDTAGYVDYVDAYGNWVASSGSVPEGAVFVRRWSIEPLPANPNNTLVLQVLVTRLLQRANTRQGSAPLPGEARLISVKTRKSR
jgi:prepilin-type N-terminal cleavage/methylation domain-containing protein